MSPHPLPPHHPPPRGAIDIVEKVIKEPVTLIFV